MSVFVMWGNAARTLPKRARGHAMHNTQRARSGVALVPTQALRCAHLW
jgi:hypothetical protein